MLLASYFLFAVTPHTRCHLKLLKLDRIKDYLLMEEEFIRNQERLKPQEEKQEVCYYTWHDDTQQLILNLRLLLLYFLDCKVHFYIDFWQCIFLKGAFFL